METGFRHRADGSAEVPALISLRNTVAAWLQLVRVPNLFTVPGDPIAGVLLAADPAMGSVAPSRIAAVAGAAVLLYAAGMAGNDIVDREEDRRSRPDRPLPSRRVSLRAARVLVGFLAAAGVALAALAGLRSGIVALLLVGAIVLYNTGGKRFGLAGPLCMALCRALSVLMGAALASEAIGTSRGLPVMAAAAVFVYIAVVTWVARQETNREDPGAKRWMPALLFAAGTIMLFALVRGWDQRADVAMQAIGGVAAVSGLGVCLAGGFVARGGDVPQAVGIWVSGLLPMQAAWAAWSGAAEGVWIGLGLLLLWPVAMRLGRTFYAS
jgi:4-hydroxybenzoate polyprenyltransferase